MIWTSLFDFWLARSIYKKARHHILICIKSFFVLFYQAIFCSFFRAAMSPVIILICCDILILYFSIAWSVDFAFFSLLYTNKWFYYVKYSQHLFLSTKFDYFWQTFDIWKSQISHSTWTWQINLLENRIFL